MREEETGIFRSGIEGVLIAQQAAVDKHQPVALGVQRHRLPQFGSVVFNGQVFKGNVVY